MFIGKFMQMKKQEYMIYRVYMWIGESSTDNPRPYNPESNAPVMQF